jgi:uncharacterized protein (DUF433 family)
MSSRKPEGFNSDDLKPPPPPAVVAARLRDQRIIEAWADGVSLEEIAQRFDYTDARAAQVALRRALRNTDRRLQEKVNELRAAEFWRLQKLDQELAEHNPPGDHKVTAERRLIGAEVRKLYGVDLQREVEAPERFIFQVEMRLPGERGESETVDAPEVEENPPAQLEPGDEEVPDGG